MGDDEGVSFSGSGSMTEAEKRRLRRRQRILENQGQRLQRILSDEGSTRQVQELVGEDVSSMDGGIVEDDDTAPPIEIFTKSKGSGVASSSKLPSSSSSDKQKSSHGNHSKKADVNISNDANLASLLNEFAAEQDQEPTRKVERMGVQSDGSVLLPKISYSFGRILICLLGVFLSLLNAKQYMITFLSWEFAFYWMNGLPPMPPPNTIMVLVALMGLKESQLKMLKKCAHIVQCILTDFSLFLLFVFIPHIFSKVRTYG